MDLWIRSQNKENLIKTSGYLRISELNNSYIIQDEQWYDIGTYKTKERALEVLDEIQKHKDKLENAWFLGMTESNFVSSTYEMPEE